jgi:hypothetical protein
MKKKLLQLAGAATLIGASTIGGSHYIQLQAIKHQTKEIKPTLATSSIDKDLIEIKKAVVGEIKEYGGGLEFIIGDFDNRDGEARCGGIAREICIESAKRGFESDIYLEQSGPLRLHYYTVLTRNNQHYRMDGHPEELIIKKIDK